MFKTLAAGATAAAAIACSLFAAAPAAAGGPGDIVPPGSVSITSAKLAGTGCPNGNTVAEISEDKKAITITYEKYLAGVGIDFGSADKRKFCKIILKLAIPSGYTYAIASATYRGYAQLQTGAIGTQTASYWFTGMGSYSSSFKLDGPYDDPWLNTDKNDLVQSSYLPCGKQRDLIVSTDVVVKGSDSDKAKKTFSSMSMDSADVDLATQLNISWTKCP